MGSAVVAVEGGRAAVCIQLLSCLEGYCRAQLGLPLTLCLLVVNLMNVHTLFVCCVVVTPPLAPPPPMHTPSLTLRCCQWQRRRFGQT